VGVLLPSAEPGDEPIAPLGEGWLRVSAQETATPSPDSLLPWKIGYAGVDRKESSRWVREGAPASVYGQRLIYTRQRQGAELINSLNRIAPDSMVVRTRRVGPLDASGASVRETWVRSGERSWLVWHRYRVAGVTTSSGTRAKLLELWAFLTRRRQAELVALTAPCDPESCTPAARSLFHFVTGRELPADEGSALQGGGGTPPRGADAAPGASGSPDA
jgi:EpsI family protein